MGDTPERTRLYREMSSFIVENTPWIFEGVPISYRLQYDWLENMYPHDFAFNRWKYLAVDAEKRAAKKSRFKALDFSELRGK
jgi:hypothetical protein